MTNTNASKSTLRITSTMALDWPQHGFALRSNETGVVNDFASVEAIPAEVRPKLTGFIRSGHVRIYDISGETPREVTPTVPPLTDEGKTPESDATTDPLANLGGAPLQGRPNPNAPVPQELGSDVSNSGTPGGDKPQSKPKREH